MRPLAGGDAALLPRSRKSSTGNSPVRGSPPAPAAAAPTTFIMRSEEEMLAAEQEQEQEREREREEADRRETEQVPDQDSTPGDSTYGVQSLDDTLGEPFGARRGRSENTLLKGKDEQDGRNLPGGPSTVNDGNVSSTAADVATTSDHSDHGATEQARSSSRKPLATDQRSPSRRRTRRRSSCHNNPSLPITPLHRPTSPEHDRTSTIHSTPKSVSLKSFQLSDEEEASICDGGSSQAVASSSSGDERDEEEADAGGENNERDLSTAGAGSEPQLVMPSIKMPARRPFTERGKALGKLKVLVAGAPGVGKTSLIRSIVQLCEDIVHVDPLSPTMPVLQSLSHKHKRKSTGQDNTETHRITEIYASTRAYPAWWSEVDDESRILRRRRSSVGDTVLERNLCFVDTPGYQETTSTRNKPACEADASLRYVESLLQRNAALWTMSDAELLGVMSGSGGVQVDVVLYVLSPHTELQAELEHIQELSTVTNVIPLIGKADTLEPSEVSQIKKNVLQQMQAQGINPFHFGQDADDAIRAVVSASDSKGEGSSNATVKPDDPFTGLSELEKEDQRMAVAGAPFSVSSLPGPDLDTMDASLLMSPDYMQPLLPSELANLVSRLFDPDNAAWLRHSAVKKFLSWRRRTYGLGALQIAHPSRATHTSKATDPLSLRDPSPSPPTGTTSPPLIPSPSTILIPTRSASPSPSLLSPSLSSPNPSPLAPTTHSLALLADHTQRETRLAQVRLARWATDLDRSLRHERARFESLRRSERDRWLTAQLGVSAPSSPSRGRPPRLVGPPPATPTGSGGDADARGAWTALMTRRGHVPGRRDDHRGRNRYGGQTASGAMWRDGGGEDPLGLCELGDGMRRGGLVMLKVLGGAGVVGAVVVAMVRGWDGWWGGSWWVGRGE